MSLGEPTPDSTPLFSEDSEVEEVRGGDPRPEAEPPSGVSEKRARLTVFTLCYVNLLNYMDRFTVAGRPQPIRGGGEGEEVRGEEAALTPPAAPAGVLPNIARDFGINDEKSGLLQTGEWRLPVAGCYSNSLWTSCGSSPPGFLRRNLPLHLLSSSSSPPQSSSAVTCFWLQSSVTLATGTTGRSS